MPALAAAPPIRTETACQHCGTRFVPSRAGEHFCCAGCGFVHGLIGSEGLGRFYDLKGRTIAGPVKSSVFHDADYAWLAAATAEAEAEAARAGELPRLDVRVQGISCVACVWLIEAVFHRHAGALRIEIEAQSGVLRAFWSAGEFDFAEFARDLSRFGYAIGRASGEERRVPESRALMFRTGVCGAFAMNAMAFSLPRYLGMSADFAMAGIFQLVAVLSATFALFVGGGYFFQRAFAGLRAGRLHIDAPIALGLIAAYLGSLVGWALKVEGLLYFDFVAVFVFLMLLGRWVQMKAVEGNRNRLLDARRDAREVEIVGADGEAVSRPVGEIVEGDSLRVRPGAMVPVRARVLAESAEFSLETINGEAEARIWNRGGEVPAGAVVLGREPAPVQAMEAYGDSLLARLLADTGAVAGRNLLVERVLQVYLVVVMVIAAGGFAGWLWATGSVAIALQVFISVLVVSCPCAIGVAMPLVDENALNRLRSVGMFVRTGDLWGRLARVKSLVFDKTGTLTLETPELRNPEAVEALDATARARLSALVRESFHPLARALREALPDPRVEKAAVREEPGNGVWLRDADGTEWSLGKPGWRGGEPGGEGLETHLRRGGKLVAAFRFREAARGDARQALADFRRDGLEVHVLSGDQSARVDALAAELGIDGALCLGGLSPTEKAERVESIGGARALYIGDGANDSLAFDAALCRGTPACGGSLLGEKSDFYFMGRGLRPLRMLFEVAAFRRRAMAQAFAFAVAYNLAAVWICLAGKMNPLLAAILMPLSSLLLLSSVAVRRGKPLR